MTKYFKLTLAAICLFAAQAKADTVFCVNCGTEWTQLVNYAQLAEQTSNMIQQLEVLQQQAARMTSSTPTSQTAALLTKLFSTVNQGQALGYSLANIEKKFQTQYPQFGEQYGDYYSNYKNWSMTTSDSIRAALSAAGVQSDNFATEEATAATLRALNSSAGGQMQAIQIGNAVSSEMLDEMRKMRQLQMSQNQAHNAFLLQQQQESDSKKQVVKQFFQQKNTDVQSFTNIKREDLK